MTEIVDVHVPDLGDFDEVEVIEIFVSSGENVAKEASLITLESDKSALEIPAPQAGKIESIAVKIGDHVSAGSLILTMTPAETSADASDSPNHGSNNEAAERTSKPTESLTAQPVKTDTVSPKQETNSVPDAPPQILPANNLEPINEEAFKRAHASPSVRKFARELGVDLGQVTGSGKSLRILKSDVQAYIKARLKAGSPEVGAGIPPIPVIDFGKFGKIEKRPLSRIQKISGPNLHRAWLNVPHVTQFDEADITGLDAFRKIEKNRLAERGIKLTPLAFFLKACALALREHPIVNSSLELGSKTLILKKYIHIGLAVDTPDGLMVPVIRDVDKKGLVQLAQEAADLASKAREKKLPPGNMQGGSFSISSLGSIGGTAFTPIINAPEAAILGISKAQMKPVYNASSETFEPRLMLPLSLSYDHRIIDGALAARFTQTLSELLKDVRQLAL